VQPDRVLAPFGRRAAPITAREQFGPYIVLRCDDREGPRPQAGQFYMLQATGRWGGGDGERPFLPRAFSVLRAPQHTDELHFLVEDVGPGTHRLCELQPDDELLLVGPLGIGFRPPSAGRRAILVGGGVGIAPLAIWQDQLATLLQDPASDRPVTLLGFRDHDHARGAAVLSDPALATDDGSVGHEGFVTELLADQLALENAAEAEVYACGPPAMLEAVRVICAEHGVRAQLALESGMACGFGACFGCVVPTRHGYVRLCVDGPVLDAAELEEVVAA
jgi:dihydroorotate dehydrogenase electron transfer subunit